MDLRMKTLVDAVPACERVIDVGCDHGQMSLALAEREDVGAVLATDISAASLSKLEQAKSLAAPAVARKIETAVADGLRELPWENTDVILVAGMGGPLMLRILEAPLALCATTWVLGPQSGLVDFRLVLYAMGRRVDEALVFNEGQFYPIFRVWMQEDVPPRALSPVEAAYGPQLLARRDPVLRQKLEADRREMLGILEQLPIAGDRAAQRRRQLEDESAQIEDLLKAFSEGE